MTLLTPSDRRSGKHVIDTGHESPVSEFEKLRQAQETRNEVVINYIYMAILAGGFMFNFATRVLPVAPYRASDLAIALILGAFATRLAVFFYLRVDADRKLTSLEG